MVDHDQETVTSSTSIKEICLETWMSDLPSNIRNLPLNHVYIPGSHDSFSYSLRKGETGPDAPMYVSCLASVPCVLKNIFLRWSITQRSSVYEQLLHGIRYFDVRVALRDEKFYFVHLLLGSELNPMLKEIRRFLDDRPGEVVLIDFQHFYGLEYDDHLLLLKLLTKIFSGIICPWFQSLETLSLAFLSKHKYQVILFYRNSEVESITEFWPSSALPNPWPDTMNVSYLLSFLKEKVESKPKGKFFVTQCVLTPTLGYILRYMTSSLECKVADPCNKAIFNWIQFLIEKDNQERPNVMMSDFVEHNDWEMPKAIIECNLKLFK